MAGSATDYVIISGIIGRNLSASGKTFEGLASILKMLIHGAGAG